MNLRDCTAVHVPEISEGGNGTCLCRRKWLNKTETPSNIPRDKAPTVSCPALHINVATQLLAGTLMETG